MTDKSTMKRAKSLDALRGYAIMTMILSAMEAFKVLPAWMYHAQVPPPDHIFTPTIFGITWVDLIFPFFLFSMGAAIPLSLGRQFEKGVSRLQLCWKSVLRWIKLTFFSIYILHTFPFMLGYENQRVKYAVAIAAFLWMFVMFMRNPFHLPRLWDRIVNTFAYAVGIAWILFQPYAEGKPFSLYDSDIIILILANVSVAGSIIYICTMKHVNARLAIIPFILALFLSASIDGSWQQSLDTFTPIPWMYQFRYLEYLLIIIPGTVAGDLLKQWLALTPEETVNDEVTKKCFAPYIMLLSLAVVITNVVCLYNRVMILNLALTTVELFALHFMLSSSDTEIKLWQKFCRYGAYLLMLGLCVEAFQGGIRKDDVTFSYLFVTGGLAFFAMTFFSIACDYYKIKWISMPLELTGKNPMIAYVSGSMVVIPVLGILGIYDYIDLMSATPWLGFLKGVILTALCMIVTSIFTTKKIFWKT